MTSKDKIIKTKCTGCDKQLELLPKYLYYLDQFAKTQSKPTVLTCPDCKTAINWQSLPWKELI